MGVPSQRRKYIRRSTITKRLKSTGLNNLAKLLKKYLLNRYVALQTWFDNRKRT